MAAWPRPAAKPWRVCSFRGFEPPDESWSKLPHALVEALRLVKTIQERKVVLYVLRHTWGFQEFGQVKRISSDEFIHGRRRRDGTRLDDGTGLVTNS